jgi:hypothetical protein
MQEGQESFQTNKQCKKDKNHFRRTSNARMTRIVSDERAIGRTIIVSDEQAMREGQESFQTNEQRRKDKNHFKRTSNARMTIIISDEQAMQEGQ